MVENMNSLARFDSTRLVIVIIVQNIGIRLEVKANNWGSFFVGSYTNIFQSGKFLSNREARSSYSPNLGSPSNITSKKLCPENFLIDWPFYIVLWLANLAAAGGVSFIHKSYPVSFIHK